jgi:hypothetical protein
VRLCGWGWGWVGAASQTNVAQSLCYLDAGHVYVGARVADAQLVQLSTPQDGRDVEQQVRIVDQYQNIGPIVDVAVVALERQGQVRSRAEQATVCWWVFMCGCVIDVIVSSRPYRLVCASADCHDSVACVCVFV